MLEASQLNLAVYAPTPLDPSTYPRVATRGQRWVMLHHASSGELLGFAYWRQPRRLLGQWLALPRIAIHESGDEPLLFNLARTGLFSWDWEVTDADDQVIGVWNPVSSLRSLDLFADQVPRQVLGILHDRQGELVASLVASEPEAGKAQFLSAEGQVLGSLVQFPERLQYGSVITPAYPPLAMVLVGVALIVGAEAGVLPPPRCGDL